MNNHGRGEASLSGSSIFVCAIVSEDSVVAVLLFVGFAWEALPTRANYTTNSHNVFNSKFPYIWTQLHNFSHHFMPSNQTQGNEKVRNRTLGDIMMNLEIYIVVYLIQCFFFPNTWVSLRLVFKGIN